MEQNQFDRFARYLGSARSRRAVLATGLAALLPLESETTERIAAKPKQCGPCEVRQGRRKCQPALDNRRCKGNGRCLRGKCNRPPTCLVFSSEDPCSSDDACCNGNCDEGSTFCGLSGPGQRCVQNVDCLSNSCVGYRCEG